jgi:hypothetical protein
VDDVDRNIRELEENCKRLEERRKYFEQKTGKRISETAASTNKVKTANKERSTMMDDNVKNKKDQK